MRQQRPILLVEDDDIEAMTVERALKDLKITNPINHVSNGEEALAFLRNDRNERPALILLDLNMPRMSGIEFLKVVKADEELKLKTIPVVVLTTSHQEIDKSQTFKAGIDGYMVKPIDYRQFVEVIRTIHMYWSLSEVPEYHAVAGF